MPLWFGSAGASNWLLLTQLHQNRKAKDGDPCMVYARLALEL
jgi:hypothetical protein